MAKLKTVAQDYPRISDEKSRFYGCLDDSKLVPHVKKVSQEQLKTFIISAIEYASRKSSREILSIPPDASEEEAAIICKKEGKDLFNYFKKYCGDPAATAHQIHKNNFRDVCKEQFRNRTLQMERMNSGWRYQALAVECAHHTKRFKSISDIGTTEADFNAIIEFIDKHIKPLNLYVSIKNRSNTIGGQDWPNAIAALEEVAKHDKNRTGPYCCVFGIAMDRGYRRIKNNQKGNVPHSVNTEIWLSDFFWPFFTNFTYEEIMTAVLDVLIHQYSSADLSTEVEVPAALLDSFGECCLANGLVDDLGNFNDPYKLVKFFCNK
jgi:hypothetical protein